ncbi:unnamed protein product [Nyctereutes procyonoides]|uniref:(raccoon dog) hypothetical protein n=1 Tax=Nyctereutes procyonoides TaxID=34880 RepID=A0A811Y937_NYCPR|nr:unnamed protein product [Nyctereutes procyonoides]
MKRAIMLGIQMTVGSPQQKVSKKTRRHTAISGNEFSQQPKGREPGSGLFLSWVLDENADHQHLNHASNSSQPQRTVALPRREESRAQPRPSGPLPSSGARRPPSPAFSALSPARARVACPCGSCHPFCSACNTLPPRTHPQGSLGRPLPAPRPPASLQSPGRLREAPRPPPPRPAAGAHSGPGAPHTSPRTHPRRTGAGRSPGEGAPPGPGPGPGPGETRGAQAPGLRRAVATCLAVGRPPPPPPLNHLQAPEPARPATGSRSPPLPGRCLGYPSPAPSPARIRCGQCAGADSGRPGNPGAGRHLRGRPPALGSLRGARLGAGPRCGRWA